MKSTYHKTKLMISKDAFWEGTHNAWPERCFEAVSRAASSAGERAETSWPSRCFLFSFSTSGPPIWPGSTFFKRNGALLQGRSPEAPLLSPPAPPPFSTPLCLVSIRKVLSRWGVATGEVWLLRVGSVCPVLFISSLLMSSGCYELFAWNQDCFFSLSSLVIV